MIKGVKYRPVRAKYYTSCPDGAEFRWCQHLSIDIGSLPLGMCINIHLYIGFAHVYASGCWWGILRNRKHILSSHSFWNFNVLGIFLLCGKFWVKFCLNCIDIGLYSFWCKCIHGTQLAWKKNRNILEAPSQPSVTASSKCLTFCNIFLKISRRLILLETINHKNRVEITWSNQDGWFIVRLGLWNVKAFW